MVLLRCRRAQPGGKLGETAGFWPQHLLQDSAMFSLNGSADSCSALFQSLHQAIIQAANKKLAHHFGTEVDIHI